MLFEIISLPHRTLFGAVAFCVIAIVPRLVATQVDSTVITFVSGVEASKPFIHNLHFTVSPPANLKGIRFIVAPRSGSITRALSANYPVTYLTSRGLRQKVDPGDDAFNNYLVDYAIAGSANRTYLAGLSMSDDRETALLTILEAGAYTAIVTNQNIYGNGGGVALVEVFNLDPN